MTKEQEMKAEIAIGRELKVWLDGRRRLEDGDLVGLAQRLNGAAARAVYRQGENSAA